MPVRTLDCVISSHNHYIDFGEQVPDPLFADVIRRWPIMYIYVLLCFSVLNRGSDMSAQVLLNLLNKLGKSDKMRGLPSILLLFPNDINIFNNTGA